MKVSQVFTSRFLRAEDLPLGREVRVVIESVALEQLGEGERPKLVLTFRGKAKRLPLNKTNAQALADGLGDETDNWSGRQIIVYAAKTLFAGRQVNGVRVRVPEHGAQPAPIPQPQPAAGPPTAGAGDIPF